MILMVETDRMKKFKNQFEEKEKTPPPSPIPTPTHTYTPRGTYFNDLEKHLITLALKQYIDTYKINVIRAKDKKRCKNLDEIIEMNKIYKKIKNMEYINIDKLMTEVKT